MMTTGKQTLSKREQEIISLMAEGFTSRQIGEALGITTFTVQTHRRNMLKKLQLANARQVIAWGYKEKVLT